MDREKMLLFCALVGWFACVIQCLMDMQCFLFVCLFDGWLDGWVLYK